jgi:hypothetical protein
MDVTKNFKIWAELLDFGFEVALKAEKGNLKVLKRALEYQNNLHHKANIEIFKKLEKYDKQGNNKNIK